MGPSRSRLWLGRALIFGLISASTAAFLLCPCDIVMLRDHRAVSLVGVAFLFAAAAAVLVYRQLARDSGITGFLRAVFACAFVAACVYVELFLALYYLAWLARPR